MNEIRERYTKVEEDYIRSRKSSKEKITDYLSEKAAVIQSEYLTQLKKLRTDLSYRHPVSSPDMISSTIAAKLISTSPVAY